MRSNSRRRYRRFGRHRRWIRRGRVRGYRRMRHLLFFVFLLVGIEDDDTGEVIARIGGVGALYRVHFDRGEVAHTPTLIITRGDSQRRSVVTVAHVAVAMRAGAVA